METGPLLEPLLAGAVPPLQKLVNPIPLSLPGISRQANPLALTAI
jgi:hypothetical protein